METRYAASPNGDAAPIRLSYVAVTAMTGQCGQWPEDLSDNSFANKNWYNFGCASRAISPHRWPIPWTSLVRAA